MVGSLWHFGDNLIPPKSLNFNIVFEFFIFFIGPLFGGVKFLVELVRTKSEMILFVGFMGVSVVLNERRFLWKWVLFLLNLILVVRETRTLIVYLWVDKFLEWGEHEFCG